MRSQARSSYHTEYMLERSLTDRAFEFESNRCGFEAYRSIQFRGYIMKDYFGNELAIDDIVAFCRPNYRELCKGKIVQFTPKQVRVEYDQWSSKHTYLGHPDFFIKEIKAC